MPKSKTGGKPVIKNVPLADITADTKEVQARVALSEETIGDYGAAMLERAKFPPCILFDDGKTRWLSDGFHRYTAAIRTAGKVTHLLCEVRKGTKRDAMLFALGANTTHGLRRTSADKRKAVALMLQDNEWKDWSSRQIAKQCNVSPSLVDNIRNESPSSDSELVTADIGSESQASAGAAEAEGEGRKYITKHGTESTMRRRRGTASRRSRQQASDEGSEPEEESEPEGETEPALPAGPDREESEDEEEEDQSADLVAGAQALDLDKVDITALQEANEKLTADKQALESRVAALEGKISREASLLALIEHVIAITEQVTKIERWPEKMPAKERTSRHSETQHMLTRLRGLRDVVELYAEKDAPADGASPSTCGDAA